MRFALLLLPLLMLTGCADSLELLRRLNPAADNFPSALASEYLDYASSESEQGRAQASDYYAQKGLKASKGEAVEPDPVPDQLPPEQKEALVSARADLFEMLNDTMKQLVPQKLARAQLMFDCWQYQVSNQVPPEQALCAEEFGNVMNELDEVADKLAYENEDVHYFVFAPESATLDEGAHALARRIARAVKDSSGASLELTQHDGRAKHIAQLERKRLTAISKALAAAGVPANAIHVEHANDTQEVCLDCSDAERNPDALKLVVKTHAKGGN